MGIRSIIFILAYDHQSHRNRSLVYLWWVSKYCDIRWRNKYSHSSRLREAVPSFGISPAIYPSVWLLTWTCRKRPMADVERKLGLSALKPLCFGFLRVLHGRIHLVAFLSERGPFTVNNSLRLIWRFASCTTNCL